MAVKNYVLIDFENVQPKNMEILKKHPFAIYVFLGEKQNKVSADIAIALQGFGESAKYIKISGSGPNALDFHIAFYLGKFSKDDPKGHYHIVSKDTGFDPLVRHLKSKGIKIDRVKDLAEIPVVRIPHAKGNDEKINEIAKNLKGRGQSRPRKLKTLSNTINSLFTSKLSEPELDKIIQKLKQKNYISIDQEKVSYHLPKNL